MKKSYIIIMQETEDALSGREVGGGGTAAVFSWTIFVKIRYSKIKKGFYTRRILSISEMLDPMTCISVPHFHRVVNVLFVYSIVQIFVLESLSDLYHSFPLCSTAIVFMNLWL